MKERDFASTATPAAHSRAWRWIPVWLSLVGGIHVAQLAWVTRPSVTVGGFSAIRYDDERNYYLFCADGFARDGGAFLRSEDSLRSPPIPWLWLMLWSRSVAATRYANIVLVLIASYLLARIARAWFGERIGVAAFLICSLGYQVVLLSGTILSEPPTFGFVCLMLWGLHRGAMTGRSRWVLIAGAACGAAALTRASFLVAPVVIVTVLWLAARRRRMTAWQARDSIRFLMAAVVVIAPWAAKNYVALGVPRIANGFGAVMYLGSDLRTDGDEPPFCGMQWQTGPVSTPFNHMQTEGDRRLMAAALQNIRRHPVEWIRMAIRKIGRFLIGGPRWHFYPADNLADAIQHNGRTATIGSFLWWTVAGTLVTIFGIAGLAAMAFVRARAVVGTSNNAGISNSKFVVSDAALALLTYLVILHAISYSLPRFAMPIYPALVLGACAWLAARRRFVRDAILAAVCVGICASLAVYHRVWPSHIQTSDPAVAFTIDARWPASRDSAGGSFIIDAADTPLPFNACLFIRASASRTGHRRHQTPLLVVTPSFKAHPAFDETAQVLLPLIPDGTERLLRFCVELNPAWRGQSLAAVRIDAVPGDAIGINVRELILAH